MLSSAKPGKQAACQPYRSAKTLIVLGCRANAIALVASTNIDRVAISGSLRAIEALGTNFGRARKVQKPSTAATFQCAAEWNRKLVISDAPISMGLLR